MNPIRRLVLCLALGLLAGPALAAAPPSDREVSRRLDAYVKSFADTGLFSGVVMVRRNGRTIYASANGVADRAFGTPVALDTKFQIASLSKPMTSAAIGRLVDQGKLAFETPIETIVPGIPNGQRITIEHLLTHRSGLDSPDRSAEYAEWRRFPATPAELVDRAKAMKPRFEAGERYNYANANYWILALVIETVSGKSYGDFLRDEIFRPLGMNQTAHRADVLAVVPALTPGYQLDGPSRYRVAEIVDWTTKTGNGSVYSTAADLLTFHQALKSGRLLKPETTRRIFGVETKRGMAWFHRPETFGIQSVYFNGRSPGYTSYLEGFVDEDVSFVLLSNLYVYAPTVMADGVAAILQGKPQDLQKPIRLFPADADSLRKFEGLYQFGPTFHVRDGKARVVADGDHMVMKWEAGGLVTPLLPTGPNTFFDPTFWATLEFTAKDGAPVINYVSHGFTTVYEARRIGGLD